MTASSIDEACTDRRCAICCYPHAHVRASGTDCHWWFCKSVPFKDRSHCARIRTWPRADNMHLLVSRSLKGSDVHIIRWPRGADHSVIVWLSPNSTRWARPVYVRDRGLRQVRWLCLVGSGPCSGIWYLAYSGHALVHAYNHACPHRLTGTSPSLTLTNHSPERFVVSVTWPFLIVWPLCYLWKENATHFLLVQTDLAR